MIDKEMELLEYMILFQKAKDQFGDYDQWVERRTQGSNRGIGAPYPRGENSEYNAFLTKMGVMLGCDAETVRIIIGAATPILPANASPGWWNNLHNLAQGYMARAAALAVGFIMPKHLPLMRLDLPESTASAE